MVKLLEPVDNIYVIRSRVNIGYICIDKECYMIDSGLDQDQARRALNLARDKGLNITTLLNTHSHADHIGGNKFIYNRLGMPIYSSRIEASIAMEPVLEPVMLYGGYPLPIMRNKLLMADPSNVGDIANIKLPFEVIDLKGHSPGMIGFKGDNYIFVGDSYLETKLIKKHKILYNYHPGYAVDTLENLLNYISKGLIFIPSHGDPAEDPQDIIYDNIECILRVKDILLNNVSGGIEFNKLFNKILLELDLKPQTIPHYILYKSAYRGYISWLLDEDMITLEYDGEYIYVKSVRK